MKNLLLRSVLIASAILLFSCGNNDESPGENTVDNTDTNYHRQSVGSAAEDILSDGRFKAVTVTILAHPNFAPSARAVTALKQFLLDHTNKPEGISVEIILLNAAPQAIYTSADVRAIEDEHRTQFNDDDGHLQLALFYLNGNYETENVLGIAYRNTSMAIFAKRIHQVSGGLGQPSRWLVESSVNHHELGHLMGLVNLGSPMQNQHQDEANGQHCIQSSCLMHFSIETGDFLQNLVGASNPPPFDKDCLDDIAANGGKNL